MRDLDNIAGRIMERRKKLGMTQKALAEKTGLTIQHVSYMEAGKRSVSWESMIRLASVLGTSVDYFLTGDIVDKDKLLLSDKLGMLSAPEVHIIESIIDECIALYHQNRD